MMKSCIQQSRAFLSWETELFELSKNEFWTTAFYSKGNAIKGKPILDQDNRRLWGFSDRSIISMSSDSFDGVPRKLEVPVPSFFRRNLGLTGFENIAKFRDETYIIGSSDGLCALRFRKGRAT